MSEPRKKSEKVSSRRAVNFEYEDGSGKEVFLSGSFNNWQMTTRMRERKKPGHYSCRLLLEPGEYQYKFVVDGNWCLDAENPNFIPNDFGTLNSLLIVREREL